MFKLLQFSKNPNNNSANYFESSIQKLIENTKRSDFPETQIRYYAHQMRDYILAGLPNGHETEDFMQWVETRKIPNNRRPRV